MVARLRQFRFDWKLTLLTALLLPLLLSLGSWQLRREQEKLQLQEQYAARESEAPVSLAALDPDADLQYRRVEFSGEYDNAHSFLLDNRIHQGQVGYEAITPVLTTNGGLVLVNRGWLPQGATRADLPELRAVDGRVDLRGSVYVPVGKPLVLGSAEAGDAWPRIVQTLDVPAMATDAGHAERALFPYSVRLDEGMPGVLVRDWPVISTTPEKHRAYAVQWFAMAAMLLALYLYYSTRPDTPSGNDHHG
ncbi:MAG TPA: SURF1 family protein [Pseudomonadales bacterium]